MPMSLFSVCYVHEAKRIPKKNNNSGFGSGEDFYLLQTFDVFAGIDIRGYPQFVSEDIFVQTGQEPVSSGYCVVLFVSGRKPGTYVPKYLYNVPEAELEQYLKMLYFGPRAAHASIFSMRYNEPEVFRVSSSAVI